LQSTKEGREFFLELQNIEKKSRRKPNSKTIDEQRRKGAPSFKLKQFGIFFFFF
jgi:hypothetical protein